MGHRGEEDLPAQALHLPECRLHLTPLADGLLQPFILLATQGHADRLAPHFARPLIAGAAGPRSPVLHVALADPARPAQALPQPGIFLFPRRHILDGRFHKKRLARLSIRRYIYRPMKRNSPVADLFTPFFLPWRARLSA